MHGIVERLSILKASPYSINCILTASHGKQKLLKIQRIHLLYSYTAYRYGWSLCKSYAKFRTTRNVAISAFFVQKFQHGHQVRIALYLVKENNSILLVAELVASNGAQL